MQVDQVRKSVGNLMDFDSKNLDAYVKDLDTVYTSSDKLLLDF